MGLRFMMRLSAKVAGRLAFFGGVAALMFGGGTLGYAQSTTSPKENNQVLAISADRTNGQTSVQIATREPVGYRYTVYDSTDPSRVVIDFPGMDVTRISSPIIVDAPPVSEIRVSSFDLTSGRLGRVELLLTAPTTYNVFLSDSDFRVAFAKSAIGGSSPVAEKAAAPLPAEVGKEEPSAVSEPDKQPEPDLLIADQPVLPTAIAKRVESVDIQSRRVVLTTDGAVARIKHFSLGAPPRLVVDLFGVKPAFKEQAFKLSNGFSGLRLGNYPDKTRFVFDAMAGGLPKYTVENKGNEVIVGWGENVSPVSQAQAAGGRKEATKETPVTVDAVDFKVEDGKSVVLVSFSGSPEIIEAEQKENIVLFGIKNARISRALRRTIDASAFPSAVRLVTPHTTQVGKSQDVHFSVELKGPTPYFLKKTKGGLEFVVENGPFAEPAPPAAVQMELPVPQLPVAEDLVPGDSDSTSGMVAQEPVTQDMPWLKDEKYKGQKISLVFDDADIRRILQLIAEVSNLNIIASDDVKGTITLRLIDVPWDQALDLIMEIKGLGMVREGNVVRIMPRDQIRAAAEAKLTAARTQEKLEDLVTEAVSVSYTNLSNVAGPAKELLTERGKLTEDARNKKLIVKDIPSVVREIRDLVALLDTPERQVMIEARIVEANSTFTRNLGISWGLTYDANASGNWDVSKGAVSGGGNFVISPTVGNAGLGSSITFGRVGIDNTILDLRISALETASQGKVISTPRVSTLNGQAASISQGTKIPYQSSGTDGLPKTEFVDANLELTVTPEINPDNSIILDIDATNSSPTLVDGATAPGISTKEAKTKLLVRDGETTVIGGIYVEDDSDSESGIPWLRKIPYLGHLFKSTTKSNNRSELLIFITPRIVR